MIYVLIPSYNESKNLELLLKNIAFNLKGLIYKVLIIDDGSTDDTHQRLKKLTKSKAHRIGYKHNRGPGTAFRYGFDYLIPKLKKDDLVVTMEADNTSDFKILRQMLKLANSCDVVLASPYAKGGKFLGVSFYRLFLSYVANHVDRLVFRVGGVRTYSSFYRVYRGSIILKARQSYGQSYITETGFSVFVEFLVRLAQINAKVVEVAAILDWNKRLGKSKNKIFKALMNHLFLYINFMRGKYSLPSKSK